MASQILEKYLKDHEVPHQYIDHSTAFTAPEVAAAAHVSGKQMAKTVIIKIGSKFIMVVLPASEHINFSALKEMVGSNVDLAKESEFKSQFPECELGAMPPFGNLYDMPVYVSNHLSDCDQIVFNAGTHTELVKLAYQDFERLVHPKVIAMY